ncbi:efflux RND transporter periplasmic adaptor subunit [Vibrio sp. SCSIO 43136]|uniref:efflux RND transporter periplasmic adaptor subunit n=1 Tax=Vibrio sp. SCSIO 43136 TaxID=2819101 RepID=UPI0020758DEB|nr:efflux RND transporter periplasmic adaptor subunit [Vibrio sp. SCSIO 43136]USD67658.1 efflux RND transporter periplasmic adaptor subunit [Vibrio sp. SCSIO 43136]
MPKAKLIALLCAVPAMSFAATEVSVIKADYQPIFQTKTYSTSLIASQRIAVISQTSGEIVKKMVRNGQRVEIGDVLIQLDDRDYQLNHMEAEANLDLAKANYNEAKNERERAAKLVKSGGMSTSKFEQVDSLYKKALAGMELAKVAEQRAALDVERTKIRAKTSGKVINLFVDQGQHVSAGTSVCDIINDDNIDALVEIPSNDSFIQNIEGLSAELTVDTAGYQQAGKLFAIDGAIDPTKSTLKVRYRFDNQGQLLDGQFGKVTLSDADGDGNILVPQKAVLTDRQGKFVYIAKDGVLEQQRIQSLGKHKSYELVNGLQVNDMVVVSGTIKLYPGLEVEPKVVEGGE